MDQGNRRSWVKSRFIGSIALLALALTILAACGHGTTNSANNTSTKNNAARTNANSSSNMGMRTACDPMVHVTIAEHTTPGKADQYTITPAQVTIKSGEFITFSNQTDEVHVLTTTPAAALASTVAIDKSEDQPVQFSKAGTYTVESQNAQHRASMKVTVTSPAGTTCGMSAPSTTITFTEKHTPGQADLYSLAPNTVMIKAGQSVNLWNKTKQALNFTCKPNADLTEGNLRVDANEQQLVQFAKAGQYSCSSSESSTAKIMVVVH